MEWQIFFSANTLFKMNYYLELELTTFYQVNVLNLWFALRTLFLLFFLAFFVCFLFTLEMMESGKNCLTVQLII